LSFRARGRCPGAREMVINMVCRFRTSGRGPLRQGRFPITHFSLRPGSASTLRPARASSSQNEALPARHRAMRLLIWADF
jgi:hypothetical protein